MATQRGPSRPTKVRIFGRDYSIHFHAFSPLNDSDLGNCNNIHQVINIADGLSPVEEADTLLHEVLHGIVYTTHLELSYEQEERVVATLATGLMGGLQDNPRFAQWLIQSRDGANG